MDAIARMILTSLPTIEYGAKAPGSMPIEITDTWRPGPRRTARELTLMHEIESLDRSAKLHGVEAVEGLTPEMIDLEAELSWDSALNDGIPSREELMLMAEDANAPDDLSLALRWLDPPTTNKTAS